MVASVAQGHTNGAIDADRPFVIDKITLSLFPSVFFDILGS